MPELPVHLQTNDASAVDSCREPDSSEVEGDTRRVDTVVVAIFPEYHQVNVRDGDGRMYALTRKTQGVDLTALREGLRVVCTVTGRLPRVSIASAVT